MSFSSFFIQSIKRDFQIAAIQKHEFILPVLFFILVIVLFPITVGPDGTMLSRLASAVGWIALILSMLIALPRMFAEDFENGWLEQVFLSGVPHSLIVLSRIVSFWLLYCLPLVFCSFLLVPFMSMEVGLWSVLVQTLLLGSILTACLGAVASALLVASRKGGGVMALLLIPLLVPSLIFAGAAMDAAQQSLPYTAPITILAALAVFSLTIAPLATAQALKLNMG
ncbi:heme exporter protein CcmB [Catenovulum agarivorans DS-2]|uniref:Heme exporter protein B n=1 Tax=Catenovulum agarivorans DS-2 TaxID=1328313 RepID=W7QWT6_9ALTE|nr:heme exporter protein CcmB [Catenovulum agarivorans]EWH12208.1 heme exporter protein CcmB [Catenovulum agarivorans DS-2]